MKRALLIATGTVGGLGAVLAITPPQLGSTSGINIAGAPIAGQGASAAASASSSSSAPGAVAATTGAKPVTTQKAGASKKAATANSAAGNSATTAPAADAPATQTAATTAATSSKSISGTFTGPSVNVNYGNVQVKITVVNGRITDAVAVKAPTGRNDRWTNMAVPILKEQTLKAQSANIQGASGASYTSYGWYTSLQGALAQAGL
jgi:uncharacterized protein with FMN-binding domain